MTIEHANITDANRHEAKGIGSASDDQVLTSTSNASVWKKITSDNIDTTDIFNTNVVILTFTLDDASTANSWYIPIPITCTISRIYSAIDDAISTANEVLTFRDNAGSSMGTITITQSGSAAGDIDSLIPASNNTVIAGNKIQVDSSGASTNAIVNLTFVLVQTA